MALRTMTTSSSLLKKAPLLLSLVLAAWLSTATSSSASPAASSWTNNRPSTQMPWNDLPTVDIRARAWASNETTTETMDAGYNVIILGCCASTNNATTNNNTTTETVVDKLVISAGYETSLQTVQTLVRNKDLVVADAATATAAGTTADTIYASKHDDDSSSGDLHQLVPMQIGNITNRVDAAKVGTALANKLVQSKAVHAAVLLTTKPDSAWLTEVATALLVGLYKDERFKSNNVMDKQDKKSESKLQTVDFIYNDDDSDSSNGESAETTLDIAAALKKAHSLATGVYLTKDIVNAPHNVLNSVALAHTARKLANQHHRRLSCRILTAEQCQKAGMGAYLGVARGSETEAKFIHLTYHPPRRRNRNRRGGVTSSTKPPVLGIVGKGLLFDTGGYNIKTGMMELMKFDCGGAAAVLGAARAIAQLEPDQEVHFVVAACENMINAKAMVPGDILTASNGKTIEVINTDAEGRLTMADALVYVDRTLQCDEILELSTLTGACMVALGPSIAGLWTHNSDLAASLESASAATGEKIWRMPMEEEYKEGIKSKIADLRNLGGRYGGAIAAALFLQHFVDGDKPFAHVDMAGPVWSHKAGQATGWGAKLVTEWVCQDRN